MFLYNRHCRVVVGGFEIGGHVEVINNKIVEPVNVEFDITHTITRTPNEAEIRFYNLSPESQAEITKEGLDVEVEAGYSNKMGEYVGTIFKGKTRRTVSSIESQENTLTTIYVGDGDDAFKYAKISKTVPAGLNDPKSIVEELASKLNEQGIDIGEIRIEGAPDKRATTLDRSVRLELDEIARRNDAHWSIQDGKLNVWPKNEPIDPQAILIIDADSGLIGAPEKSENGVTITTLLLHELRPGYIIDLRPTNTRIGDRELKGLYRIEQVNFSGAILNGEFVANVECRRYEGTVSRSRNRFSGEGG